MEELVKYFEDKNLSVNTITVYLRNLKLLNDNKDFKNLNFLKNKEYIDNFLNEKKTNTKKNYYISIVASLSSDKKYKKLYDYYVLKMNELNKEIKDTYKEGKKSVKESENWLSWENIVKVKNELVNEAEKNSNNKALNSSQYYTLLKSLVLSLYVDIPPRRNDYIYMNICKSKPFDNTNNWLCVDPKEFIFNKFKTAKNEGELKIEIPEKLYDIIIVYLKHHPLLNKGKITAKTNEPFLVNHSGEPLKINGITYILNDCFKSLNKKISSSMLRHIYLTDKYGDKAKEQEEDAKLMSHSVDMQQGVYVKKD